MILILGIPLLILSLSRIFSIEGFKNKISKEENVLKFATDDINEPILPESETEPVPAMDTNPIEKSEETPENSIPIASEAQQLESIDNLNPADFETVPSEGIPNKKKKPLNKLKHSPKSKNQVNYASTYMSNLKQYNDILGNDGLFKMTKHTKELMQQQNQLGESIAKIVPLIQQMTPFLNTAGKLFNGTNNNILPIENA